MVKSRERSFFNNYTILDIAIASHCNLEVIYLLCKDPEEADGFRKVEIKYWKEMYEKQVSKEGAIMKNDSLLKYIETNSQYGRMRLMDYPNLIGQTPLDFAVINKSSEVVRFFLKSNVKGDTIIDNVIPAFFLGIGSLDIINTFLEMSPNSCQLVDSKGFNCFHQLAEYQPVSNEVVNQCEIAERLFKFLGPQAFILINQNCSDSMYRRTPLHIAVAHNLYDLCQFFLSKNAAIDAIDINGFCINIKELPCIIQLEKINLKSVVYYLKMAPILKKKMIFKSKI